MSKLVIFYSRTGTTKKIAEQITGILSCDFEEIFDIKNRLGFIGWLKSGKDAMLKKLTILDKVNKDPGSYDLIIIGTPIWAKNMSTPIRTYISENMDKFKKLAFFCTEGSKGGEKCFKKMAILCDKEPVATLEIKSKEIKKDIYADKIISFTDEIKKV